MRTSKYEAYQRGEVQSIGWEKSEFRRVIRALGGQKTGMGRGSRHMIHAQVPDAVGQQDASEPSSVKSGSASRDRLVLKHGFIFSPQSAPLQRDPEKILDKTPPFGSVRLA